MGYQKYVFSYWFQKCKFDLTENYTQEKFFQKTVLPIEKLANSQKNRFLGKTFFWVHFLIWSNVHFWNQYKKTEFLIPHSTYSNKKTFHLIEGSMYTFYEQKGPKCKQPLNIS